MNVVKKRIEPIIKQKNQLQLNTFGRSEVVIGLIKRVKGVMFAHIWLTKADEG